MNEYDNLTNDITPVNFMKKEENGVAGQGNKDPRSEFGDHAIVKYNNKYYDPSYGSSTISNSKNEWENNALDGFGSILRYKSVSQNFYFNWVGHLNDKTNQQCEITP